MGKFKAPKLLLLVLCSEFMFLGLILGFSGAPSLEGESYGPRGA